MMLPSLAPALYFPPNALRAGLLAGLGEDPCPAIAPIRWSDGTCSNYAEPGTIPLPGAQPGLPPNYSPTPGAAEASRAAADAEGAEAERQGAALGLSVDCITRANCGPSAIGGNPGPVECLYWSECTVNGDPGHDAGLLIQSRGWQVAATEASYQLPSSSQAAASTVTGRPNQSVPPKDTSVPMDNGVTNPAARMASSGTVLLPGGFEVSTGTLLLVAAGAAALFLMRGRR
jgi:hypothetical protein